MRFQSGRCRTSSASSLQRRHRFLSLHPTTTTTLTTINHHLGGTVGMFSGSSIETSSSLHSSFSSRLLSPFQLILFHAYLSARVAECSTDTQSIHGLRSLLITTIAFMKPSSNLGSNKALWKPSLVVARNSGSRSRPEHYLAILSGEKEKDRKEHHYV